MKKELPRVEWMFSFEGGGWNSVYAKTKKGAITQALKEYKNDDDLNPIASTFKISNQFKLDTIQELVEESESYDEYEDED